MKHVGAITDRPPKNIVFRISRREITKFSPYGDEFCLGKICGRSMIAPTEYYFDKLPQTLPSGEWIGNDFHIGVRVYKPAFLLRFLVIMMKKLK